MDFFQQREDIAYFMQRLYRQGLTTTSGGNLSMIIEGELMAITPAALDKGRMTPEQVALVTLSGENRTPHLRVSSETAMHERIYRCCPRVRAIVHAHPVTASVFSTCDTPINTKLLAETHALVGELGMAEYALTGTDALAEVVAETATRHDCLLMRNHGVVATGRTLLEAFDRLELIESAARMTLMAQRLEGVRTLDADQCAELDALMGRATEPG